MPEDQPQIESAQLYQGEYEAPQVTDFWDTYEPKGWEAKLMGKGRHLAWPLIKTAEFMFPFGQALGLTPSGIEEWKGRSKGDKALYLGIEAIAWSLPWTGKAVSVGIKHFGKHAKVKWIPNLEVFEEIKPIDKLLEKIKKFEPLSQRQILLDKGLKPWEIGAYEKAGIEGLEWYLSRSQNPSDALKRIINWKHKKKTGNYKLQDWVQKDLTRAKKPIEEQYAKHFEDQWDKSVKEVLGESYVAANNRRATFKYVAEKLYGKEAKITIDNASPDVYANMAVKMMDPPWAAKFKSAGMIGAGSVIPSKMQPSRFVFGRSNKLHRTWQIYERGREGYRAAHTYGFKWVGKFNELMATAGIMGVKSVGKRGDKVFKFIGSKDDYFAAGEAMSKVYKIQREGGDLAAVKLFRDALPATVGKYMKAHENWFDVAIRDYIAKKVPYILRRKQMTLAGQGEFNKLIFAADKGIIDSLKTGFKHASDIVEKETIFEFQMDRIRALAKTSVNEGWVRPKALGALTEALQKREKWGDKGFLRYLEDTAGRLNWVRGFTDRNIAQVLETKRLKGYYITKKEAAGGLKEGPIDFGRYIERQIRAHASDLEFYPKLEQLIDAEGGEFMKNLPDALKEYSAHWIFRLLGRPSPVDASLAEFIGNTYGRLEAVLGEGKWSAVRVKRLAQTVNNLVYMGGLGMKPFSALRNLAQPPMLVPADLGAVTDIFWLLRGVPKAANPGFRNYVKYDLKLIEEFAPELHLAVRAVSVGKRLKLPFGKHLDLPESQRLRDAMLWMFKMTDRWNRYLSAGASAAKWEHFAGKLALDTPEGTAKFIKKMNIKARNEWVKEPLMDLLQSRGLKEIERAKELFIKDVTGNTQYLYGITDSPILSHTWGAPGRMLMVFQSWWMNYATQLESWARTGDAGTKLNRFFTWMLSCAIAEQVMEVGWGRATATRTVWLGPIPGEISEYSMPPAFAHMYHILAGMIAIGSFDDEALERHAKGFMRATTMFIPAGLFLSTAFRGYQDEEWTGLLKSFVRYQKATDYEPFWGLGQ